MELITLLAIILITAFIARLYVGWLISFLPKSHLLDTPNERSNHTRATPRGGGLAIVDLTFTGWLLSLFVVENMTHYWPLMASLLLLAGVSFMDDRTSLPAGLRLFCQLLACTLTLHLLHPGAHVINEQLPFMLDRTIAIIAFMWFINLFNFMDGIDGISGAETLHLIAGIVAVIALIPELGLAEHQRLLIILSLVAGATIGFLYYNWHPAKIFMGDIGSISIGFLLGYSLIYLAIAGYWQIALVLPAYYLFDSTYTLLKRLLRGEKVWQAHSEHYYQRAVRSGLSHAQVVLGIAAANSLLLAISVLFAVNSIQGMMALILAGLVVALLIITMKRKMKR